MVLWFAGTGLVLVWAVFKSPTLDYRLVMLGSVLPVGELVLGGPFVLHTLVGAVAALVLLAVLTRGQRLRARRLVGLPIGLFMHLLLDGVWTRTEVFWWPFFGWDFGEGQIPELERPLALNGVLELVGLACLVWAWRRFGLGDPQRRATFLRTGQLSREAVR